MGFGGIWKVAVPCRICILLTFLWQLKNWLRVQGGCTRALLFWATSSPKNYQVSASGLSEAPESSSSWCDGFPRCLSKNPPRYASLSRTWEVDARSNEFGSTLILLSGSPEAIGNPRLFDAIGLDAVKELVVIKEVRFITATQDLDTTLSSSSWSCILFVSVQQVELKWPILN